MLEIQFNELPHLPSPCMPIGSVALHTPSVRRYRNIGNTWVPLLEELLQRDSGVATTQIGVGEITVSPLADHPILKICDTYGNVTHQWSTSWGGWVPVHQSAVSKQLPVHLL